MVAIFFVEQFSHLASLFQNQRICLDQRKARRMKAPPCATSTKVESVQNGYFLKSPIFVLKKAAAPFKVEFHQKHRLI